MASSTNQARAHHDRTLHRPHALSGARGPLDWSNRPRPDKRYPGTESRPLPTDFPRSEIPAVQVLIGDTPTKGKVEGLADIARLLFLANGVMRRREINGATLHFRTVPSAGALYPVEAYVVCGGYEDLPAGVYHFDPLTFSLQPLREGDWRGRLGAAAADPELAAAPLTVVLTGVPWRTAWKYGERGYRHLFWDAGAVAANLIESGAARALPSRLITGFVDEDVARLVGVAPDQAPAQGGEVPLALVSFGRPGEQAPDSGDPPPLSLDVEPLSREVVDEPRLWEAHRAGDLASPDAVTAWRSQVTEAAEGSSTRAEIPPLDGEPIDEVILRRGSTRRFTHQTIANEKLNWPLAVASRHVAGDFAPDDHTHLAVYAAVHDVEDVDAGAYRHQRGKPALLHEDVSRARTAELCLGQPLGGDAAYTTFLTADLDRLIAAAGDRAYRVAQLEAGVAAERLQLAAFTANVGATGLTFFDEEVRTFFDTSTWPMQSVATGVPAYEATPGRRPDQE